MAVDLSPHVKQQILLDLMKYLQEQGGSITSEKLQGFYAKHPSHRASIKNVVSFCKEYPDQISICQTGGPHLQLNLKMPSQVKASTAASNNLVFAASRKVAANLAVFLAGKPGGAMLACQLHKYYDLYPSHKNVIDKVPKFCSEHPGLLGYSPDGSGGKLYLPKHCCLFLQGRCDKASTHGVLHSQVQSLGAVHCQYGKQCAAGHWAQVEAQAEGLMGKGKGVGKSLGKTVGKGKAITQNLVAANLALFVHEKGGSITGGSISDYYNRYPSHKDMITESGVKAFCLSRDGLFSFRMTPGDDGQICLPSYCCHFLRGSCNHTKDHQGRTHAKPSTTPVICNFGPDCKAGHWHVVQRMAGVSVGSVQEVSSVAMPSPEIEMPACQARWGKSKGNTPNSVAANLALFVHGEGGEISGSTLGDYYKRYPAHKEIISGAGVAAFCQSHDGLLDFEGGSGSGRISLASYCCHFLRDCCQGKKDHQGKKHAKPITSPVICSFGPDCKVGHWQAVQQIAAGVPMERIALTSPEMEIGKGKSKGAIPSSVAANLALFLHEEGGEIKGSTLGDYYKRYPSHKEIISGAGVEAFCQSHDGLLDFEGGGSGRISLASYCCHFLRDCCPAKKAHKDGRRHEKPQSTPVCNFRERCTFGHWQAILERAGRTTSGTSSQSLQALSPVPATESVDEEIEVLASRIRWSHDCIKVTFRDERLVVVMLQELLDGTLLTHQIPQFEVLEHEGDLYAWTGNRRLWVLREFEKLSGKEVRIKVKKLPFKLPTKSPKFTTTTEGKSVTFFTYTRNDGFPSMSFALAAVSPTTAPSPWDVEVGSCLRTDSLPLRTIEALGEAGAWQESKPSGALKDYFLQKSHLFSISHGMVDDVVGLSNCIDCLRELRSCLPSLSSSSQDGLQEDLLMCHACEMM